VRTLDRILRDWRSRRTLPHIPPTARLLDIGCGDGSLLLTSGHRIRSGTGIDPAAPMHRNSPNLRFIRGLFPTDLPTTEPPFDVLTALAVLEHIPEAQLAPFAGAVAHWIRPGGRLILTVPAAAVDPILGVLKKLRLIDGMALEEHHGFDPGCVIPLFERHGFWLLRRRRFQLGLNNLFVFERSRE